jgi:hypothetical protein
MQAGLIAINKKGGNSAGRVLWALPTPPTAPSLGAKGESIKRFAVDISLGASLDEAYYVMRYLFAFLFLQKVSRAFDHDLGLVFS